MTQEEVGSCYNARVSFLLCVLLCLKGAKVQLADDETFPSYDYCYSLTLAPQAINGTALPEGGKELAQDLFPQMNVPARESRGS